MEATVQVVSIPDPSAPSVAMVVLDEEHLHGSGVTELTFDAAIAIVQVLRLASFWMLPICQLCFLRRTTC